MTEPIVETFNFEPFDEGMLAAVVVCGFIQRMGLPDNVLATVRQIEADLADAVDRAFLFGDTR